MSIGCGYHCYNSYHNRMLGGVKMKMTAYQKVRGVH